MLEIGGIEYTIDLEALDTLITNKFNEGDKITETETKENMGHDGKLVITEVFTKEYDKIKEIDMAKYETIRVLFEVILSNQDEFDDDLGIERALAKTSLPFKLSFNTLLQYGIIKEEGE